MTKGIFSSDVDANLLLHEWTKNFRGGKVFSEPALHNEAELAGTPQTNNSFPAPLAAEDMSPVHYLAEPTASCLETFAARRSVRQFTNSKLSRKQLATFLSLCYSEQAVHPNINQLTASKHDAPLSVEPKLYPLIMNVTDLAAGAYFYDKQKQHLRLVRVDSPLAVFRETCYQEELFSAPVIVLVAGALSSNLHYYGDRGYRYMLISAGQMIQRLYLAASSLNLTACVSGSIFQGKLEEWLGLDGHNVTLLMAFAVGQAAESQG